MAIDNNNIDKIESIKFLCVMLDSKQTWNYHIQLIIRTFSRSMVIIYRVKDVLNKKALYILCCSLILPYFNYACEILNNTYTSRLQPLVNLQKKVIRIVYNRKHRDHTTELLQNLGV